jgi:starch-binding outer membrane protein, SusD/RagB family
MRQFHKVALGLGLALSAAGCSDYLSAPDLTSDPTKVTALTEPGPLYIGIQEAGPPQREGQLARFAVEYTQQVAGFSRQQIGYDLYQAKPIDVDPYFGAIYGTNNTLNGGGGLLDIHKVQQLARKKNDSLMIGIAKVYEAMYMGLAADQFGDIPYREAADSTNLHPKFDNQLQIYADLQAQLDSAITIFLPASGPTNLGPTAPVVSELVYGDRGADPVALSAVYIKVAHSLKARLYMHTAEVDPSSYAKALAEVPLGIADPADDFLWFHDASPQGQNIWWQFMAARGDIAPGAALVEIVKRRVTTGAEATDTLLGFYFTRTSTGTFAGVRPSGSTNMTTNGTIYNGAGIPVGEFSLLGPAFDGASAPGDFRQPEITFVETQLIGAEAALQTGNAGLAQTYLDAARANRTYGSTAGAVVTFPAEGSVPATLQNIIEEKYTRLFLNPEVWNDYKRTCFPSLAPAPSAAAGTTPRGTPIVGRLPYGQTELNANGANAPAVTTQSRNRNDPNPCPVLNYVNSTPLAN